MSFSEKFPTLEANEEENKNIKINKSKGKGSSFIAGALGALALMGGDKEVQSAESKFSDKTIDKMEQRVNSENIKEQKLDSIGTRLNNVEAENKDYEIRAVSFSQLGFKTPDDFKKEFVEYYNKHKHEYSDIQSSGVKMNDTWSKIYLAFVNSKIEEIMGSGHESFVFTKKEWEKVREEYKRLAEQEFLRTQVGVYEETYVGDQQGCTLGKNECKKDKFGNTKISTGSLLGHPDGDFEFVVKIEK